MANADEVAKNLIKNSLKIAKNVSSKPYANPTDSAAEKWFGGDNTPQRKEVAPAVDHRTKHYTVAENPLVSTQSNAFSTKPAKPAATEKSTDYYGQEYSDLEKRKRELEQKIIGYGRAPGMADEVKAMKDELDSVKADMARAKSAKAAADRQIDIDTYNRDMERINAMPEEVLDDLRTYSMIDVGREAIIGDDGIDRHVLAEATAAYKRLSEKGYSDTDIRDLAETLARDYNKQNYERSTNAAREQAADGLSGALTANIAARGTNLFSGMTGTVEAIGQSLTRMLGGSHYRTYDPYGEGFVPGAVSNAVSEGTMSQIDSEIGKIMYQGATSVADNLTRSAIAMATGGGSALVGGLSASQAFQDSFRDAAERGANPAQAWGLAMVDAFTEWGTEKMGFDKLLEGKSKGFLRSIGAQGASESLEELTSFAAHKIADAKIMAEKSENADRLNDLVSAGMTYEDAKKQLTKDFFKEGWNTAIVAFMSGSALGGIMHPFVKGQNAEQANPAGTEQQTSPILDALNQDVAQKVQQENGDTTNPNADSQIAQENSENNVQNAINQQLSQMIQEANGQKTPQKVTPKIVESPTREQIQNAQANNLNAATGDANIQEQAVDSVGAQAEPDGDIRRSATFANSGVRDANENISSGYSEALLNNPDAGTYQETSEKATMQTAQERTATQEQRAAEYDYLMGKDFWTASDNDTAEILLDSLFKPGDAEAKGRLRALQEKRASMNLQGGQLIESNRKYTQTVYTATQKAVSDISALTENEVPASMYKGEDFDTWKAGLESRIEDLGAAVNSIADGDVESMRNLITSLSKMRGTNAWLGYASRLSKNANRLLMNLDFDKLKEVAKRQIVNLPADYKKVSAGKAIQSARIQAMLFSGKTMLKNLKSNASLGVLDSITDSSVGQLVDALVSKVTGKREVGNDFRYAGTYLKAAAEASQWAELCVELNLPIEDDISPDATFGYANNSRTFSPTGNIAIRALSAWEKYMQYGLGVSDKIFEGGTNGAVRASLEALNEHTKSNISDADIDKLSEKTANRRTFKDDGMIANAAKGVVNGLNKIHIGDFKLGSFVQPFAAVPANVAQTKIDYVVGVPKGLVEIGKLMYDAAKGNTVEVGTQRKAVTDFGRGVTGVALTGFAYALAKAGILKVTKYLDKDKALSDQAQGLDGLQMNIDALGRTMNGEDSKWNAADLLVNLESMDIPAGNFILGAAIAEAEENGAESVAFETIKSAYEFFMDSPVAETLQSAGELIDSFKNAEDFEDYTDALLAFGADSAASWIPSARRNYQSYKDPVMRDTTGTDSMESARNRILAAVDSEQLPAKYDIMGNEVARPNSGSFIGAMFNDMPFSRYNPNEITGYLDELQSRTGKTSQYLNAVAPKEFSYKDGDEKITFTLSGKETREKYQKAYIDAGREIYSTLLASDDFRALLDDKQLSVMETARQYATDIAQATVSSYKVPSTIEGKNYKEIGEKLIKSAMVSKSGFSESKYDKAVEAGFTMEQMQPMAKAENAVTKPLTAITDAWKNGKASGSTAELAAGYKAYESLTADQKQHILDNASGDEAHYLRAKEQKIDDSVFLTLYRQYKSIDTGKSGTNQVEWERLVDNARASGKITKEQRNFLVDDLSFYFSQKQKAETYNKILDATDNADVSAGIATSLSNLSPNGDASGVSDWQKFDAIMRYSGASENQKIASIKAISNDSQLRKIDAFLNAGYPIDYFVIAYTANSKGTKKAEKIAAYKEAGFGDSTAMWVYSVLNK